MFRDNNEKVFFIQTSFSNNTIRRRRNRPKSSSWFLNRTWSHLNLSHLFKHIFVDLLCSHHVHNIRRCSKLHVLSPSAFIPCKIHDLTIYSPTLPPPFCSRWWWKLARSTRQRRRGWRCPRWRSSPSASPTACLRGSRWALVVWDEKCSRPHVAVAPVVILILKCFEGLDLCFS